MRKVLTISIAAYNVASYLRGTLDSFICSQHVMEQFEVIIVNDGSKDDTVCIANEYHERYPDTFIVVDKPNGGYGSTINASLKVARGEYYKLVDGDDWVDTDQFALLISLLSQTNTDMVITKYSQVDDLTGKKEVVTHNMNYDGKIRLIDDYESDMNFAMHQICYRTALLKEIDLQITEKCFYTDYEYIMKPLPFIKTIVGYDLNVYMYRIGREGQSVQMSSWQRNIDQATTVTLNVADYYNRLDDLLQSNRMKECIINSVAISAKNKYIIMLSMPKGMSAAKKIKAFDKSLKKTNLSIYKMAPLVAGKKKGLAISLLRYTKFLTYPILNAYFRKRMGA